MEKERITLARRLSCRCLDFRLFSSQDFGDLVTEILRRRFANTGVAATWRIQIIPTASDPNPA